MNLENSKNSKKLEKENLSSLEIQKLAHANYVSFFANGFNDNAEFLDSNKNYPTSDLSNIERQIESKDLLPIGDNNYLKIRKEGDGFKLSFHFLAVQRDSFRRGSHGGVTVHFNKAMPNPLDLVKGVNKALKQYKIDNYEPELTQDGRFKIKNINFKDLVIPKIEVDFSHSLMIPEEIKSLEDFIYWFKVEFNKRLEYENKLKEQDDKYSV